MRIVYLGDEYSHTFAAAKMFCASFKATAEMEGKATVRACFDSLSTGSANYCVVPIENSVEGSVSETQDCLQEYTAYIHREVVLKIRHSLIGFRGAEKSDIKTIYSHYQALGQCRHYLGTNFPLADTESAKSTSAALKKIKDKSIAAIARSAGGGDTIVLDEGVEDYKSNETRFAVLGLKPVFSGAKCSIVFDTANEPGALLAVLEILNNARVNMTKIESRPAKTKLGRYVFFVDFDFGNGQERLTELLASLSVKTSFLKFLGNYSVMHENGAI